jgi:hypothetical protein
MRAVTAGNHDLDSEFNMVLAQDMVGYLLCISQFQ